VELARLISPKVFPSWAKGGELGKLAGFAISAIRGSTQPDGNIIHGIGVEASSVAC